MNGSFRFEPLPIFGDRLANIRSWWSRWRATSRTAGMLVTSWEPNRLAIGLTTVVDAAAACLWLDPEVDDTPGVARKGFQARRLWPLGRPRAGQDALACDDRAFAGYSRWEINERWDGCVTRRGFSRFEAERGFFTRLAARGSELPPPFRASVEFRRYVAERDVYVRSAAASVLALRRRLARHGPDDPRLRRGIDALLQHAEQFTQSVKAGRRAARALWRLSRDPGVRADRQ